MIFCYKQCSNTRSLIVSWVANITKKKPSMKKHYIFANSISVCFQNSKKVLRKHPVVIWSRFGTFLDRLPTSKVTEKLVGKLTSHSVKAVWCCCEINAGEWGSASPCQILFVRGPPKGLKPLCRGDTQWRDTLQVTESSGSPAGPKVSSLFAKDKDEAAIMAAVKQGKPKKPRLC